jgi:hypothetical protein
LRSIKEMNDLLNQLEDKNIFYRLSKVRTESIMIEVAVPGQRWEIEFMDNGTIEIEKFISDGQIYNNHELTTLFQDYSD